MMVCSSISARMSLLIVACVLLCWGATSAARGAGNGTSCDDVRQVFVMKGIGEASLVPDKKIRGRDLTLCPSPLSCCTKDMEDSYEEASKRDVKTMIEGTSSYLKTLISTSATKFRDLFLEMIQVTANSTITLFSDLHKPIEDPSRVLLGQLYADLLAYMTGKDVDLEERMNSFFDSIFPIAYHYSVNSNEKPFSDTYQQCLRETQMEVRPFGDLSEKITVHVSRSFEAARTVLESLQLGIEIINTTEHMDYGPECSEAFMRMAYCPHCHGNVQAKACTGLCLNVVRGCMSSVSELDDPWSDYVSALERLTSGMVGFNNIEQVMSTLDIRISETVSYLLSSTEEVTKRVKDKCGIARRVSRQAPAQFPHYERYTSRPVTETSLYILLQNFVRKLAESKDFYANLADRMCSEGGFTLKGNPNCWNGNNFNPYNKSVAGIGVHAQKYNPEMELPVVRDATVNMLIDKLKHVKQKVNNRVTSVPQSDSSVLGGEGSGSGNGWPGSDDEDYAGSGSGDFQKESKGDIDFGGNVKVPNGADINQVSVLLVIFCTLFLQKRN